MIDILIIVSIVFISIAFSSRNTTPELLTGILYNSEFKEDEGNIEPSEENEVVSDSESPSDDFVHKDLDESIDSEVKGVSTPEVKETKTKKDYRKSPKPSLEDKMDYLDTTDLSEDYSVEDISSESKSLIKEILSRE